MLPSLALTLSEIEAGGLLRLMRVRGSAQPTVALKPILGGPTPGLRFVEQER